LARHPGHPYIVDHDLPKLENLKKLFADRYRADPVLVAAKSNDDDSWSATCSALTPLSC
jgi:hypothetical protein